MFLYINLFYFKNKKIFKKNINKNSNNYQID